MKQHRLTIVGIAIIALGFTVNTQASGTYIPGENVGDDYNMNKMLFFKKVACSSCPFPDRGKSAEDAEALIQEFNDGAANGKLTEKETQAAISYLQRRFK